MDDRVVLEDGDRFHVELRSPDGALVVEHVRYISQGVALIEENMLRVCGDTALSLIDNVRQIDGMLLETRERGDAVFQARFTLVSADDPGGPYLGWIHPILQTCGDCDREGDWPDWSRTRVAAPQ